MNDGMMRQMQNMLEPVAEQILIAIKQKLRDVSKAINLSDNEINMLSLSQLEVYYNQCNEYVKYANGIVQKKMIPLGMSDYLHNMLNKHQAMMTKLTYQMKNLELQKKEQEKSNARAAYDVYVQEKNTASSLKVFVKLKEKFELMGDFQDALKLVQECNTEISRLEAEKKTEAQLIDYNNAKNKLNELSRINCQTLEELENLRDSYNNLADDLNKLTNIGDASKLMHESKTIALELNKQCDQIKEERDRDSERKWQMKKNRSKILLFVQIALFVLFLYVLFLTDVAFYWRGLNAW